MNNNLENQETELDQNPKHQPVVSLNHANYNQQSSFFKLPTVSNWFPFLKSKKEEKMYYYYQPSEERIRDLKQQIDTAKRHYASTAKTISTERNDYYKNRKQYSTSRRGYYQFMGGSEYSDRMDTLHRSAAKELKQIEALTLKMRKFVLEGLPFYRKEHKAKYSNVMQELLNKNQMPNKNPKKPFTQQISDWISKIRKEGFTGSQKKNNDSAKNISITKFYKNAMTTLKTGAQTIGAKLSAIKQTVADNTAKIGKAIKKTAGAAKNAVVDSVNNRMKK
ncbi:MAG TPA: hypothetical protein VHD33_07885 [Legionellaceae bacterium]|nr:hypothetical protein [Legionellaceae bacterium]